jgi:hypothetical protein
VAQHLRFATARDVFEAFPSAARDLRAAPTGEPPLAFARSLAQGPTPEDALGFCAYLLPRREAVWWSCQCVRCLTPQPAENELKGLQAAEAWVKAPQDEVRRAALEVGMAGDRNAAATWCALAAGWSGGTMPAAGHPVPVPPHLTAKAVRIAVLTALARVSAGDRAARIGECLEGAVRLATGAA